MGDCTQGYNYELDMVYAAKRKNLRVYLNGYVCYI